MVFLEIFEWILAILAIACIVTQIMVPTISGRPIFPLFRNKEINQELAETKEMCDLIEKKKEIELLKKQLDAKIKELENG